MYTNLLVPLDNSGLAECALPTAESLARATGASIDLVYVHEPVPVIGYPDAPWNAARRSSEESYIRAIADEVRSRTGVPTHGTVATGHAAPAICAHACAHRASLIVMTTHGRTGLSRAWLGSVADGIARHSPVPILLLRPVPDDSRGYRVRSAVGRILIPIDGVAQSEDALDAAGALVGATKGKLIIEAIVAPVPLIVPDAALPYAAPLSVPDVETTDLMVREATERLESTVERLAASGIPRAEWHVVVSAFPPQATLRAARGHAADVIAVPMSGRGVSRLAVGSLADRVMRATSLPLLLYPTGHAGASVAPASDAAQLACAH